MLSENGTIFFNLRRLGHSFNSFFPIYIYLLFIKKGLCHNYVLFLLSKGGPTTRSLLDYFGGVVYILNHSSLNEDISKISSKV